MATRIKLRRDTATRWQNINPVLSLGEPGVETNTGKMKIGDGIKTWNTLDYFAGNDTDANTTYGISAETATGGVNLRLTGSDASTDNVKLAAGANVTLTRTDASTITIASTGGTGGPVQPYLELTNDAFITQPTVLGTPVTVTAAATGVGAQVQIEITAGSVLSSITASIPGTGYVPGQNYKVFWYQMGAPNDASSITFTIGTVNGTGGILTITNAAFVGTPSVATGTILTNITLRASVFDEIDTGLTLTRHGVAGIYNSEAETEYNDNSNSSPLGTEWNADGWGNLLGLAARSYTTWRSALNAAVGTYIVASELVMHDTINDKYYKFDFTNWGGSNGSYAYTRTEVTDPNYFRKTDGGNEVDIIIADDGNGAGVGITRDGIDGIYNPYREGEWDNTVSPGGTVWNVDGWDDLSDVETRTYDNFYAAYDGQLENRVPGSQAVMYVEDNDTYYAVQWLGWTPGGGFSYTRKEIDLTKIKEGVKFADGTVLKTALGTGRVKSTASNDRRIEEAVGSKTVSLTGVITTNLTTVASRAVTNENLIWIDSTATTIDNIISTPANYGNAYGFEFSLDNSIWYPWNGGVASDGNERVYSINSLSPPTYLQGATVYFRYKTGGEPVVWWDKAELPGGGGAFRGAVIDYHAYTGESTIIGSIHIVDDSGEEHISHQEVQSGSTDGDNDDLWLVQNEGTISYRRIDGESKTLKVHWIAKVFYGTEFYD